MISRPSILLPALALLLAANAATAAPVTIRKADAVIERKTFNPAKKPAEMPPLKGNEAAVASDSFRTSMDVRFMQVPRQKQVQITAITMDLGLSITIWVPIGANQALKDHEEGHRKISERFYEDAETIARELASKHIDRTIALKDATPAVRQKAIDDLLEELGQAYLQRTQRPAQRVNEIFDRITRHGQNQKISVDDAIKQALKEYTKSNKADSLTPRRTNGR